MHPILTHGGSQVNVIPGQARLEMYVRGKTAEGILDASRKVDRALRAGALALGATVEIETVPGPLPLLNEPTMERLFHDAASTLVGAEHVKRTGHSGGCTDMGDVSHLMPVLHPYMGGATGTGHGADWAIVDPKLAYITPAKALASMAIDLLADGAVQAGEILRQGRPRMTREEYLAFQRSLEQRQRYDEGSPPSGAS